MANYDAMEVLGRIGEKLLFDGLLVDSRPSFVVVYGRRRIGKTYLIKNHFKTFDFYHTGVANVDTKQQLDLFHKSLLSYSKQDFEKPKNWFEAFENLQKIIQKSKKKKKVIFLDEVPWLHTSRSNFLAALEYFWNHWASQRKDVLLIICGSATSWIVNKIFNNKGGFHNRVTHKVHLKPFTLAETELFLKSKGVKWNKYQIIKSYMAFGGVPYYLEQIQKGKSADQNIDELLFNPDSILKDEFYNLYASLFNNPELYIEIIKALASKNKGLTRNELLQLISIKSGGSLTTILTDLELSGFIRKYHSIDKKQRDVIYQLTDAYSLFYYNFLNKKNNQPNDWLQMIDSPKARSWSGYAFEMVCLQHVQQIKKALGIEGIQADVYAWSTKDAQIDLIIDRKDQIINLFEIKFASETYAITTPYLTNLLNKISAFKLSTKTKKAVYLSMLTTYGIQNNENAGMVQNNLDLETLFLS